LILTALGRIVWWNRLTNSPTRRSAPGRFVAGVDPLWASFTLEPHTGTRPYVPFYRFFAYPSVLDLRRAGYEVERFAPLFDKLEDALYSQAVEIHRILHFHTDNAQRVWNPRRSREIEFEVRERFTVSV
jgi:hypothetical protein